MHQKFLGIHRVSVRQHVHHTAER